MSKKKIEILYVQIREAKSNKLFTEQQRQSIRFLLYNKAVICAECGKKRRTMWTMLCQFKCGNMDENSFSLRMGKSLMPLTPVCGEHPLQPDFPKD